jgi:hypothetical protein
MTSIVTNTGGGFCTGCGQSTAPKDAFWTSCGRVVEEPPRMPPKSSTEVATEYVMDAATGPTGPPSQSTHKDQYDQSVYAQRQVIDQQLALTSL